MKKTLLAGTATLSLLFMTGCSTGQTITEAQVNPEKPQERFTGIESDIRIITDTTNGCKYLYITESSKGSQARTTSTSPLQLNKDEVDCTGVKKGE